MFKIKYFRLFLLTTYFFTYGCVGIAPRMNNGGEMYYVAFGSNRMELKEDDSYRTFPWLLEEFNKQNRHEDGIEEILVTHSCGLFEVKLEGIWQEELTDDLQEQEYMMLTAYIPGGEFCNISDLLSHGPKLLKIKYWKGEYFILDFWETEYEGDERLFIFDNDVINSLGLSHLYKELDLKKIHCRSVESISPRALKRLLKEPNIEQYENRICYTKGVYIDEI
jgi:hypothetical protein